MTWDPCSSGQGLNSRGLEKQAGNALIAYVRDAMGCSHEKLKPVAQLEGYLEGSRGTANHRLLMRAWRCGAAWMDYLYNTNTDTNFEADAATEWMLDWFAQQDKQGWMYRECLTTNHDQLYLLGIYGLRYIAWSYRNSPIQRVVEPVLEATGKHLRQTRFLYDALSVDGHVMGPSLRCTAGGKGEEERAVQLATVDVRTVAYARMCGWPAPTRLLDPRRQIAGLPNNETSPFWKYVYNVGVAFQRQLLAEGDDLASATEYGEMPKLCNEMRIERRGDDMIASFAHLSSPRHCCWWAGRKNGQLTSSPWHKGGGEDVDCPYPIPSIPGAAVLVIPGV